MFSSITFAVLAAALGVHGHAVVEDPAPRKTGPAHEAACGLAVVDVLENDIAGPIENAVEAADEDYNCNAYLCRGYQFEDNEDNVKVVKGGDVLEFHINLVAGHHPGYANVSIVETATNEVVGQPLVTWANWPDHLSGPPRNDTDYNVTIPNSLGAPCDVAGNCVIQWYWYASGNEQTYESCQDFYVEV
ncbi:hypothetical protein ASPVEDRAFT_88757 [Aspergillus versicolor CBS 583.65]|uniref:Chitin-binding type-4 domain-containing protein n=1 Tax=Aspergillus versicolor CBS 583.65 TaxID=1036611 RepID=A0A1L9Q1B1_ASPVE|nr:uncharacterized protein ASPVEDRAFT_88757 [Aspergillus versicolor CBS 583.65]OJJ07509.1 hypothetical protein ASPVEDRAFT_88757 [Aspergillus versicolor CBS 583.65]